MHRFVSVARLLVIALSSLVVILMLPGAAQAHSGEESYVYLDIYDSTVEGRVEFPISDVNEVLGVQLPTEEAEAVIGASANRQVLYGYIAEHLSVGTASDDWPIVLGDFSVIDIGAGGSYLVTEFEIAREFSPVPRQFTVAYDGILHAKPERNALLIIGTDWGSGTFNNEASELVRFTPGETVKAIDLGDTSFWKGVSGVIGLGVEHIKIGTDHILFILALVLPSVLVFTRPDGWKASPSFGSSLWRVLKIVTMFTVAHTITLTLGGLGIVEFPSAFVETIIALSIVLAALHNIRPLFVNREWLIAFGFGLFHGFGFAGLLSDLGLTQSRRVVSLLGFNLGIELGQAVIILLIFPSLFMLRRTRFYLPTMYVGSAVLAAVAAAWSLERAFGLDLQADFLVERVVVWPRSLFLIGVITAISMITLYIERDRDRLLPAAESAAS